MEPARFGFTAGGGHISDGPWDNDLHTIEDVYFHNRGEFLVGTYEGHIVAMGAFREEYWVKLMGQSELLLPKIAERRHYMPLQQEDQGQNDQCSGAHNSEGS